MYVIAEYLFLENFLINFTILHITRIITKTKVSNKRILIASFLSALYPFALFIPSIRFLTNFFIKIIISIIIVKIAFNSKSIKLYVKQLFGFYLVSFIFAGASIGMYYLLQSNYNLLTKNISIKEFSARYLVLGIGLGGVLIKNIFDYFHEKALKEKELYEVTIYFDNKFSSLTALLDTGNSLTEPLTRLPVFIVEYEIIKNLTPSALRELFEHNNEDNLIEIQSAVENLPEKNIIRIIPFKSIGSKRGILLGFRPDYVEIKKDETYLICSDVIIGIYNGRISSDDHYKGLLSQEILNRGNVDVEKNEI
ncbi:MAG TPA: sigma-E processing peptidase SpoIIGA [Tissierellaceae bacterium]